MTLCRGGDPRGAAARRGNWVSVVTTLERCPIIPIYIAPVSGGHAGHPTAHSCPDDAAPPPRCQVGAPAPPPPHQPGDGCRVPRSDPHLPLQSRLGGLGRPLLLHVHRHQELVCPHLQPHAIVRPQCRFGTPVGVPPQRLGGTPSRTVSGEGVACLSQGGPSPRLYANCSPQARSKELNELVYSNVPGPGKCYWIGISDIEAENR